MELFRNTNIDFLGKKWYFLAFSLIFSVAGICSMLFWHHIPLGVEFRGGTLVYVKFAQTPDLDQIRHDMDRAGLHDPRIQRFGPTSDNEVLVDLGIQETSEAALDEGKNTIIRALEARNPVAEGKQDLNNTGAPACSSTLMQKDPLHLGTDAGPSYQAIAQQIEDFRNKERGGILHFDRRAARRGPAGGGQRAAAGLLHLRLRGAQRGDRRPAGGLAASQAGHHGHALFAGAECWSTCGSASR